MHESYFFLFLPGLLFLTFWLFRIWSLKLLIRLKKYLIYYKNWVVENKSFFWKVVTDFYFSRGHQVSLKKLYFCFCIKTLSKANSLRKQSFPSEPGQFQKAENESVHYTSLTYSCFGTPPGDFPINLKVETHFSEDEKLNQMS